MIVRQRQIKNAVRLTCIALLTATAGLLAAQGTPTGEAGKALISTQPARRDYRFEVASIHLADPNPRFTGWPAAPSQGRFRSENNTIVGLAMEAFGLKQGFQIEWKPWMLSTRFNVNATFPDGATQADLPIMLQHLLEDRFVLVYHRETRRMGGYELEVTNSGPKLARSAPRASDASTGKTGVEMKNGEPQFRCGQMMTLRGSKWSGCNKTMKSLAHDLASYLDVPVNDATGIIGEYDYTLTFAPDAQPGAENTESTSSAPFLRDALPTQLGLKLQPIKSILTEVVVLDSARKEFTAN